MELIPSIDFEEIPLTQDRFAIVDVLDYEWLSQWNWHAHHDGNTWYARRAVRLQNGRCSTVYMHREILAACVGTEVDHRNGEGLDNRRCNLRLATKQDNGGNRRAPSNNTSGYKGVSWHKRHQKWYAHITIDGKRTHLGHYDTREEAARAYDIAALNKYGTFAGINFPANEVPA